MERDIDDLRGRSRDLEGKQESKVASTEMLTGDVNKKVEVLVYETN
jgi:hypothetical protein